MKTIFMRIFLLCALAAFAFPLTGCADDPETVNTAQTARLVTDLLVPANTFYTANLRQLTIQGKGFAKGDRLQLAGGRNYDLEVLAAAHAWITFAIPAELESGSYMLTLRRGAVTQPLGTIRFRQSIDLTVPDRDGASIKGAVFCGTEPIVGAVVSDGVTVTRTDDNGYYWLASDKLHGYVFVSIPNGYEAETDGSFPRFWAPLESAAGQVEQHNFELLKSDAADYTLLVMTDMHLANRLQDLSQFIGGFEGDVRTLVASNPRKCIAVNLGDMTFDLYWKSNRYGLSDYRRTLNDAALGCPVFHVPGNHDNDPYTAGDFDAEAAFKRDIGPTCYSFNAGGVHYVMLDDNFYVNNGGSSSKMGDRTYEARLTEQQLAWLRADLAAVQDKSKPLVVCMHCPLYSFNSKLETTNAFKTQGDADALVASFEGFTDIHIFSGHTHNNYNTEVGDRIIEHNTAAVCATWWWTGYYKNNHISKDGSPGGYGVYEIADGRIASWYYRGIGCDPSKQLRTYDMNTVKKFFAEDAGARILRTTYPDRDDYAGVGDNAVYLNVWNYDSRWTIKVTENGRELPVTQVYDRDPLHTICYDIPRVRETADGTLTTSFQSGNNRHMFRVTASGPATTLEIEVTDRFGNRYTETMTRPKAFDTSIF
ncbi:calcineurin-like phosphoesterase C-terminal domain-containing protein [Alistipes sp.]|uniref:calcineurin-like phosphoesterase C-terminal domain-containing protein n=1 Tax=Alistipes sp. TaxID=1872444 RepID=UPI003AF167A2